MSDQPLIEIDGSAGEGGGQILRTSLALSILTQKPFHIYNIRKNRLPKPGLRQQHLTCVEAARTICNGTTQGAELGSSEISFYPNRVMPGRYHFSIGTAGSTSLVLHTIYLPLLWKTDAPSQIIIEGGTHNEKAPSFHFLNTTWRGWLAQMGIHVNLEMKRPGFYPKGGGLIIANLQPCESILPLDVTTPPAEPFEILSATGQLPEHVCRRQIQQAEKRIRQVSQNVVSRTENWNETTGSYVAVTLGGTVPALFSGIGQRGKPAEKVADEACDQAIKHLEQKASVDEYSSDQILLPLVFAAGKSRVRVGEFSSHLVTNIKTIHHFLERKIEILPEEKLLVIQES